MKTEHGSQRAWPALLDEVGDGYSVSASDRVALERIAGSKAATYGEITAAGVATLLRWMQPTCGDVFFDLGSGTGRMVIQAAIESAVGSAIGVELSAERHRIAVASIAALLDDDPTDPHRLAERIELRDEDVRTTDLTTATLIWMASTAFSPELSYATFRHIAQTASRLRLLLTTTPRPSSIESQFEDLGTLRVATTWSPRTKVYLARPRRAHTFSSHGTNP